MSAAYASYSGSAEAIPPRHIGRTEMIRKSIFAAVAASLMTLSAFSGTIAILNGAGGGAETIVA